MKRKRVETEIETIGMDLFSPEYLLFEEYKNKKDAYLLKDYIKKLNERFEYFIEDHGDCLIKSEILGDSYTSDDYKEVLVIYKKELESDKVFEKRCKKERKERQKNKEEKEKLEERERKQYLRLKNKFEGA